MKPVERRSTFDQMSISSMIEVSTHAQQGVAGYIQNLRFDIFARVNSVEKVLIEP